MNGTQPAPGPWARARLLDGQDLVVRVLERSRDRAGRWWYRVQCMLLTREGDGTDCGDRVEPYPVEFSCPADMITPIPGQDYRTVPGGAGPHTEQPEDPEVELVLFGGLSVHAPQELHLRGCWTMGSNVDSRRFPAIDRQEAARLSADGKVNTCPICMPQRAAAERQGRARGRAR